METPRIFVVIPVYNVEKYLCPCVESLRAQTFTDWQAVLVDDGSTDSSGALCDELAAQEPRLLVIHQSNGGLAAARNTGMSVMRGEALAFLDSDDVIPPEFLQELWNAFEGNDLVLCDAEEHDLNGGVNLITGQWALSEGSVTEYIRAILYAEIPPLLALCCWKWRLAPAAREMPTSPQHSCPHYQAPRSPRIRSQGKEGEHQSGFPVFRKGTYGRR